MQIRFISLFFISFHVSQLIFVSQQLKKNSKNSKNLARPLHTCFVFCSDFSFFGSVRQWFYKKHKSTTTMFHCWNSLFSSVEVVEFVPIADVDVEDDTNSTAALLGLTIKNIKNKHSSFCQNNLCLAASASCVLFSNSLYVSLSLNPCGFQICLKKTILKTNSVAVGKEHYIKMITSSMFINVINIYQFLQNMRISVILVCRHC